MPMLRFSMGVWVMSLPRTLTVPALGEMKPVMVRRVVVLPQPEGPRKVKNSPSWMSILMSFRALKEPKVTSICSSLIMLCTSMMSSCEKRSARYMASANRPFRIIVNERTSECRDDYGIYSSMIFSHHASMFCATSAQSICCAGSSAMVWLNSFALPTALVFAGRVEKISAHSP